MTTISRMLGGLYGQALGDAFCTPPYLTRTQTRAVWATVPDGFQMPPADHDVHGGLKAGQFTDDTEQALFLARQIIADGVVTLEGAGRAVVAWYDHVGGDTVPFVGPSTRRGVARMKAGEDLRLTGLKGDTNGAAMRVSVVGLLRAGDIDAAIRDAALTALPTHNTAVAVSAACAVAAAVAQACTPDADVRSTILAGVDGATRGAALGAHWLGANVARRIEFAVSLAKDGPGDDEARLDGIYDLIGTSLAASEAVPAAFGVFALAEGDPVRAAKLSFALAGDADTIGAIACAMAGALRGVEAIPADLRAQLRAANPGFDLDDTASKLFALSTQTR
jgi:ADP-ribosylglycohydrolase